jgi:cytoskeleton protein RodZ
MPQAEAPGMSLGAYLRSLREAKGGSLEDMARSTRVGIRHLEALEDERLADLPSPVFVRGFIRAYCSFLRENPEPALGRYQELAGTRAAEQAAIAPPRPRNTWASSSVVVGLVLLLILGVGLILVNLSVKKNGATSVPTVRTEPKPSNSAAPSPAPTPAPAPVAPLPAASAPTPTPAPTPPPAPAATVEPPRPMAPPAGTPPPTAPTTTRPASGPTSTGGQRLVIRAVEPTWVRVQTDEGRIAEELLPAGASREWAAERRFLVTIGNAGGVEVTLNGKALPPLGPKGTVIQRLELPAPPTTGS